MFLKEILVSVPLLFHLVIMKSSILLSILRYSRSAVKKLKDLKEKKDFFPLFRHWITLEPSLISDFPQS